ncbi:MAG: arsenate reductase ArsC [Candidatus Kapaibacteriales bacterium]
MKVLILCTSNSCRSQMAEGILKKLDPRINVFSAGTNPASKINQYAVRVMKEIGIDISPQYPKDVKGFINDAFDYVITVCDNAKQTCPVFTGVVKKRLHIGFEDPAEAVGSEEEILPVYRRVRDEIREAFLNLYYEELRPAIQ